jgi:Ca2+-binding EF-hand superfamily protein
MGNLGSGDRFDEEAFLVLFDEFDEDKSGTIDKVEMVQLI